MLEDIEEITNHVFDKFMLENKRLTDAKTCHNIYRKLSLIIDKSSFIAEHHLNADLDYELSKPSYFSTVATQWKNLLNDDLYTLNVFIKDYLQELMLLSVTTSDNKAKSLIGEKYHIMYFDFFVKERYSIGFIEPSEFLLISHVLNPKINDNQKFTIDTSTMINLTSHNARKELQNNLRDEKQLLEKELQRLKAYILKNYTLESLL